MVILSMTHTSTKPHVNHTLKFLTIKSYKTMCVNYMIIS